MDPLQTIIYSFHMPLFFFISGMLFDANKYPSFGSFLRKRFQTLIAPYFLFSFASLAYKTLVTCVSDGAAAAFGVDFLKGFLWIFIAQFSQKVVNTPLWFVPCLFLTECIYFWVCKIKNKLFYLTVITIIIVFGWFTESRFCPIDFSLLPWNFSSACFSIGFYAAGQYLRSKAPIRALINSEWKSQLKIKIPFIAVCLVVTVLVAFLNGHISIGSRVLNNGFLLYISGIIGSVLVLLFGNLLQNIRLITFWGQSSFYIMAVHKLAQNSIFIIYKLIWHGSLEETPYMWGPSLIILVIDLVLCTLFSHLYLKYIKPLAKYH